MGKESSNHYILSQSEISEAIRLYVNQHADYFKWLDIDTGTKALSINFHVNTYGGFVHEVSARIFAKLIEPPPPPPPPKKVYMDSKQKIDAPIADFMPGIYKHYKGGLYRAMHLAEHHETRAPMVVYLSLDKGTFNVRPWAKLGEDSWTDQVREQQLDGDGPWVPRFEFVKP